ncbi:AAA family ATPase [Zhihengliuella sp. ISTPL4]|uniref:AAA family ATPase n=1 Tax=Zhihengliuella sp. ISTPL4 TaxID=2058657 RepID=UPI000C7ACE8D|nr:AAA family ATPase [Zhihengliuella sp. ISTPL4]
MADVDATPNETHGFSQIKISGWRQFGDLEIDFHKRLTILTGANATGKSTLLGLLARHFSWDRRYSSSPLRRRDRDGNWTAVPNRSANIILSMQDSWVGFGSLTYGNGATTSLELPTELGSGTQQYDVLLREQREVVGVYLASHRLASGNYNRVESVPTSFGSSDEVLEAFIAQLRSRLAGEWTQKTPMLVLKETLLASAAWGQRSTDTLDQNAVAAEIWTKFQDVLRAIFPETLGFVRLIARTPEVVIETSTGEFLLDEASGGLSALVEVSWQIFLRSLGHKHFTVLLDEPENHLHPTLQRDIMPGLLRAFPTVQFIVATHSPFVVTATPDSTVYALDYDEARQVFARKLDYANKAGGAEETLTRVLGLDSTMPRWAESRLDHILEKYLSSDLDASKVAELRIELEQMGLIGEFAPTLAMLAQHQRELSSSDET